MQGLYWTPKDSTEPLRTPQPPKDSTGPQGFYWTPKGSIEPLRTLLGPELSENFEIQRHANQSWKKLVGRWHKRLSNSAVYCQQSASGE